jgi:hypothetical protein
MDLNQFAAWQAEKPDTRAIQITAGHGKQLDVWAYDSQLEVGQYVKFVSEINLEGKKEQAERARYEALKKRYEGESK